MKFPFFKSHKTGHKNFSKLQKLNMKFAVLIKFKSKPIVGKC